MRTIFIRTLQQSAFLVIKGLSGSCRIYHNRSQLLIGRRNGRIYRSLLQFDLSALPRDLMILNARLVCCIGYDEYPDIIKTIDVFQILSKHSAKKKLRRNSVLLNRPSAASMQINAGMERVILFDLTALVQNWYCGAAANLGVLMRVCDETCNCLTGITSSRHWDSQQWPYLEISYLEPGAPAVNCALSVLDLQNNVVSADDWRQTPAVDILCFNYSYIIVNTGQYGAIAVLQQSADGQTWQDESRVCQIAAGCSTILIPEFIVKYARVRYKSEVAGKASSLTIYLQGRTGGN